MLVLLLSSIICVMTLTAAYIFFCTNTINALLCLIFLVINFSILLLILGAEFFAIIYFLIYIGVIVVFFVFVLMIVNLRSETVVTGINIGIVLLSLIFVIGLSLWFEYYGLMDFHFYERLTTIPANSQEEFWFNELLLFLSIKTLGFYMFVKYGILVFFVALILLAALIGSLNIVASLQKVQQKLK